MKKVLGLVTATLFFATLSVHATNIAVVSMEKVAKESLEMQEFNINLKAEAELKNAKLNTAGEAFKKKVEKFKKDEAIMGTAEKEKAQQELMAMQEKLQKSLATSQEELAVKRQKGMDKLDKKLRDIVQKIAVKQGYDIVLGKELSLYAADSSDITDKVISEINAKKS